MGVIHPRLGDDGAIEFAALYRGQFGFVWSLTAHFGVPPAAREDVAQEVWLTVHRRLDTLRADASPRAWVASITRRVASRHHRAQHRVERKLAALEAIEPPRGADPCAPDAIAMIDAALAGMDADQREVFLLTQVEELTGPEVARILEVPLNTVYSRLRLARARLAASLAELAPDEHDLARVLREPEPARGVSVRVWLVLTGELGLRSSATLVGAGWTSKLVIAAASGVAAIAIGTTAAAVMPAPAVLEPVAAIATAGVAHAEPPAALPVARSPAPTLEPVIAAAAEPDPIARARPVQRPARAEPAIGVATAQPSPRVQPSDDIVAENKLIGAAMSALRTGDLAEATRMLDRHRTQFPAGKLTIARRAAQARVACASGDVVGARASARTLLAEHPGDPDAVGVRDVCSASK